MMTELRPCPFCGCLPDEHPPAPGRYWIECSECHVRMEGNPKQEQFVPIGNGLYKKVDFMTAKDVAYMNWNRRFYDGKNKTF